MSTLSKKMLRTIALALVLFFSSGPLSSIAVAAPAASPLGALKETSYDTAMAKIEPDLQADLAEEETVEAIIYLKARLDSEGLAEATGAALGHTMTPQAVNQTVARRVVEGLKATAETSQAQILDYLEQEQTRGNVTGFESFHVANVIYVEATKEVIENLAFRGEVQEIFKMKTHTMERPVLNAESKVSPDVVQWNITRVKADQVWDLGIDGMGAVVGSLDSGVDWMHPALKEKWRGYDADTGQTDPNGNWFDPVYSVTLPADSDSHGTHVMGTAVGQEPDGSNPIGVAPGAKWIAARVFNTAGSTTDLILLQAAAWMLEPGGSVDNKPDVVNNSWGGGAGLDDWYRDSVSNWRAAGIFPVFSAGNQRTGEPAPWPGSISVPSNYPESFAVAATDSNDIRASFSKLGPSPYDETLWKPNISAPGVNIYSSIPGGYTSGYSGTSMAAPHISGVAALLRSADASLTPDEIEQIITDTARGLTDGTYPAAPNYGYGYGMVDALEAVSTVASGTGFVRGKVLVEGSDSELPVISHVQPYEEVYAGSDLELAAEVSDDVSVTSVELLLKPHEANYWILVPMTRKGGDHKSGTYAGTISYDMFINGGGVVYKIRATDYAGNEVVTGDYNVDLVFGILPDDYSQGFEEDSLGWIIDGDWQVGPAVEGFDPAPFEGANLAGTLLGANHSNSGNSWLITPPIDLREAALEATTLRFNHWFNTYNNLDYGQVLVTNDYGLTWTRFGSQYFGASEGWKEVVVDLEDYIGSADPVFVAFNFLSNASTVREGWYVDNVRLVGVDTDAPAAPLNLTAQTNIRGIALAWDAAPEGDLDHYNVYRSDAVDGEYTLLAEAATNRFMDMTAPEGVEQFYAVTAVDFSGNESDRSNTASATAEPYVAIFGSDFEEDNGGFIKGETAGTSNDWEWGTPTSGPGAAASGLKLWATNLVGNYTARNDAYIESADITIPADSAAVLTFTHWWDYEGTSTLWDYGQVMISNDDGATWTNITPNADGKYGRRVQEWQTEEISLADYEGQTVKIRFFHHTDGSGNYSGWYVDDVYVMGIVPEEEPVVTAQEAPQSVDPVAVAVKGSPFEKTARAERYEKLTLEEVAAIPEAVGGIPAQGATVTVLETGRTVKSDPATGSYSLRLPMGAYTLKAEAYGYYPSEATVTVEEEMTTNQTFLLDAIPTGSISGRVVDRYYGNPASFATLRIMEDPNVDPVMADEDGYFTFPEVYVGDYTLRVVADGFEPGEFPVTVEADATVEVELGLKRFVGFEEEIIYDDGTGENALVLNAAPNGLAVRFTPEQFGKVTGANIYFWDNSWPIPGGNSMGFLIYSTDENGVPAPVGEPIFVDDLVRGAWNFIDLSGYGFSTDRDFYISTIQSKAGSEHPGGGIDEDSPHGDRSYMNIGGEFQLISSEDIDGALMIRALVENSVSTPVITNLEAVNYTNQDTITVEGTVGAEGPVNVYLNGEKAVTVDSEGLTFSAEVALTEDISTIMVSAELDGVETEPSPEVTVIRDQVLPVLDVLTPVDGENVNVELIHVTGTVQDEYLATVTVNCNAVAVDEDGNFHDKVIVTPGENTITVEAMDLAGNLVTETRTVQVSLDGPVITDMTPAEDIEVEAGDTVTFSFQSETEGASAYFSLSLPIELADTAMTPMAEVAPGSYEATWTVPEGIDFRDARVSYRLEDRFGNRTEAVAPGTISIGITREVLRVAGDNRIRTAIEASKAGFAAADTVILVNGYDFPDALAGAPLAKVHDAPILLTAAEKVHADVLAEIQRLGADRVILLGGETVISPAVEEQLADYTVERIAGKNRIETAALIAAEVVADSGTNSAILVSGYDFPDGLSVGPTAAIAGRPNQLTLMTLTDLGIENVTIVGGPVAVSEAVTEELETAGFTVDRIAGSNRYDTALQVAAAMFGEPDEVVIASGENFPDALAAGPLATRSNAPLLLVQKDRVRQDVLDYLKEKDIRTVHVLGGDAVISEAVFQAIEEAIQ